jgi:hypothetical protein
MKNKEQIEEAMYKIIKMKEELKGLYSTLETVLICNDYKYQPSLGIYDTDENVDKKMNEILDKV